MGGSSTVTELAEFSSEAFTTLEAAAAALARRIVVVDDDLVVGDTVVTFNSCFATSSAAAEVDSLEPARLFEVASPSFVAGCTDAADALVGSTELAKLEEAGGARFVDCDVAAGAIVRADAGDLLTSVALDFGEILLTEGGTCRERDFSSADGAEAAFTVEGAAACMVFGGSAVVVAEASPALLEPDSFHGETAVAAGGAASGAGFGD